MAEHSRLDALEQAVARLTKEVVGLRTEVRRLRGEQGATVASGAGGPPPTTSSPAGSATASPFEREAGVSNATPAEGVGPGGPPPFTTSHPGTATASPFERAPGGSNAPPASPDRSPSKPYVDAAWAASLGDALSSGKRGDAARGDLEGLVGRYGTLALAALTLLMGVGAFLGWAVRQGFIGPELRVALGGIAALAIAGVGWRLRRGDSPRFGNILLALALAIVHVVCWGAGPLLGLVPEAVALGFATAASAALAYLALREGEQALFNVGFGGALLAPFVTSSGRGDPIVLLVYGALVLATGMRALRDREWSKTPFVFSLGIAVYTAVATNELLSAVSWPFVIAPAVFAIGNAWLALLIVRGAPRTHVAYVALLSALAALIPLIDTQASAWHRFALAAVLTATAFTVSREGDRNTRSALIGLRPALLGALILPVGALAVALSSLADTTSVPGMLTALFWAAGSAAAAWFDRDGQRGIHAFVATAIGGLAIALAGNERGVAMVVALAAYGAGGSHFMRHLRLTGIGMAAFAWLAVGAAMAFALLAQRTDYEYTPFMTSASLSTAAVSAAWLVFSWNAARSATPGSVLSQDVPNSIVRLLGAVILFLWIREELAHAFSTDVSVFFLVAYYAVTGMVAIGIGRRRRIPMLRQVGLALAVFAAIKVMVEASSLAIGWRVAGFMLAGLFLLGVAYWYRAPGKVGRGDTLPGTA